MESHHSFFQFTDFRRPYGLRSAEVRVGEVAGVGEHLIAADYGEQTLVCFTVAVV